MNPTHPARRRLAALPALLAALLFGASAPLCKILLGDAAPLALAALLYLGSGMGLVVWMLLRRLTGAAAGPGSPWRAAELRTLAGAVLAGGILAPALFLAGLFRTPASSASLLLNLELVFTVLLAFLFFREGFEGRVAVGLAVVLAGCVVLGWPSDGVAGLPGGVLPIAAACLCWALDNNLTQRLADRDPVIIAAVKGLAGGAVNALLALGLGQAFPEGRALLWALGVGLGGYGLSLVLFVVSLGRLGTARTVGVFAAAPFAGAALSVLLLGERITPGLVVAAALLLVGLAFALGGRHAHLHAHQATAHAHAHRHDDGHHEHDHDEGTSGAEPHDHTHRHEGTAHIHSHHPDTHHRHEH